jgi:hypothetical protein
MHLDPVGLRRRAHAHTVLPSIVTQLNYYYPTPEVFHSGSRHNARPALVDRVVSEVFLLYCPSLNIADYGLQRLDYVASRPLRRIGRLELK